MTADAKTPRTLAEVCESLTFGGRTDLTYREREILTAAESQIAELKRDAERLDWLAAHDGRFYNIDRITSIVGKGFNGHQDLRYAIDDEREGRK